VINQLKAWCSRRLSDAAKLEKAVAVKAGRRRWFTEGGNHKTIEDEEYLNNAVQHVMKVSNALACASGSGSRGCS
jgi:hypothetical protein